MKRIKIVIIILSVSIFIYAQNSYSFGAAEYKSYSKKNNFTEIVIEKKQSEIIKWKDITSSYNQWTEEQYGSGNEVNFDSDKNAKYILIVSKKGRNSVWIESDKINGPGTFKLEAMVKYDNVVSKGDKHYYIGKFQVVLQENGEDVEWPVDADFIGSSPWHKKTVEIELDQTETAVFRIGLQRAKGSVFVKDIKILKRL